MADAERVRSLGGRVKGFRDARVADLVLESGWVAASRVRDCQERIDRGGSDLDLAGLLLAERLITPGQAREIESRVPALELGRHGADVPGEVAAAVAGEKNRFGKYVIIDEIGRGGMGIVHRAWQGDIGRWVALKLLKRELSQNPGRFLREARLAAQVLHPNLVPIYDAGEVDGTPYMAMALIRGGTLDGRRLPIRRALETIQAVAQAVHELHAAGILHRDIKPGNLLLDAQERVYLGDFGLARDASAGPGMTRPGLMLGTPAYAPPEQLGGDAARIGRASDVYSLGATLYTLLTGEPPFTGSNALEVVRKSLGSDPPPVRSLRPDASHQVETIVAKAMRKPVDERYATAGALADDIGRFLNGETLLAKPPTWSERIASTVRRRRLPISLGAVLAIALAVFAGIWISQRNAARRETERVELAWRAEVLARNPLEWAEVLCFTGLKPAESELAAQRSELAISLKDVEASDPVLAEAVKARFEFLAGATEAAERAWAALEAGNPSHPSVPWHRGRAHLVHYLATLPYPVLQHVGAGEWVLEPAGAPTDLARVRDRIVADLRLRARGHGTAKQMEQTERLIIGAERFVQGDLPGAEAALEAAVRMPETRDDALSLLGYVHLMAGNLREAEDAWTKALDRRPRRVDLRVYRAAIAAARAVREHEGARIDVPLAELTRVVADHPGWGQGWAWRGMLGYFRVVASERASVPDFRERLLQAASDFEKAAALGAGAERHGINRATALGTLGELETVWSGTDGVPRLREALAILEPMRVTGTRPEDLTTGMHLRFNRGGLRLKIARQLFNRREFDEAATLLEACLQDLDPVAADGGILGGASRFRRAQARTFLSWIAVGQGTPRPGLWEAACGDFEAAIGSTASPGNTRLEYARSLYKNGVNLKRRADVEAALVQMNSAIDGGLDTSEGWWLRGLIRQHLADHRGAVADLTRSLALQKSYDALVARSQSLMNLGMAEDEPGILDRALDDLDEAARLKPADARPLFLAGLLHVRLGRREDAIRCFEKARTLTSVEQDLRMIEDQLRDLKSP